jgi:hypothetical protein
VGPRDMSSEFSAIIESLEAGFALILSSFFGFDDIVGALVFEILS